MTTIDIPKLMDQQKAWEAKKALWLEKQGTTFASLNTELYKKILEARRK